MRLPPPLHNLPSIAIPFRLKDEPENVPLVISDEDVVDPASNSVNRLFAQGFEGKEGFGPVSKELPLASLPASSSINTSVPLPDVTPFVTLVVVSHTEAETSSSRREMRRVIIEVPGDGNLLRISGQANVRLKPLIGPVDKKKLESHNSLTLMNDIVHSSLKVQTYIYVPFSFSFITLLPILSFLFFAD